MAPVISQSSSDGKRQAVRLCESDPAISEIQFLSYIVAKAGTAWLKNEEVLAILEFFVEKRTDPALIFPDVAGRWRTPGMSSSFNFVPLQSQLAGLGHCHSLAVSPSECVRSQGIDARANQTHPYRPSARSPQRLCPRVARCTFSLGNGAGVSAPINTCGGRKMTTRRSRRRTRNSRWLTWRR